MSTGRIVKNALQVPKIQISDTVIAEKLNNLSGGDFHAMFKRGVDSYKTHTTDWEKIIFSSKHFLAKQIYTEISDNWKKDLYNFIDKDPGSAPLPISHSLVFYVLVHVLNLKRAQYNDAEAKSLIITTRSLLFNLIENTESKKTQALAKPLEKQSSPSNQKPPALIKQQEVKATLLDNATITEKLSTITEQQFPVIFFSSFNSFPLHRFAELRFPWRPARPARLHESWKKDLYDFLNEETPENAESLKFHVLIAFFQINKQGYRDEDAQELIKQTKALLLKIIKAEETPKRNIALTKLEK